MDVKFKNYLRIFVIAIVLIILVIALWPVDNTRASTQAPSSSISPSLDNNSYTISVKSAKPNNPAKRKDKPFRLTPRQVRYLTVVHVNNLTYSYGNSAPALEAFRFVAQQRGWTPAEIASWEPAALHIMKGESGYCPNLLRGARLASTHGCVLAQQGPHEDAGFAQLIALHYRSNGNYGSGWLCAQERLCSKWDIIASPWNSMTSFVALIERSGVQPWCYDARARQIHWKACGNPGYDV